MVRCYTKESGVRNLERQIAKECRKIIVRRLEMAIRLLLVRRDNS